jgi:hypothetical protein
MLNQKRRIMYLMLTIVGIFVAACGSTTQTTRDDNGELPAEPVLQAQSWLADQLGVTLADVSIVSSEHMEWPDSCLGLGGAAESCAAVVTPGWQANFEVNGETYEVRVDDTATSIRSPQITAEPGTLDSD